MDQQYTGTEIKLILSWSVLIFNSSFTSHLFVLDYEYKEKVTASALKEIPLQAGEIVFSS